MTGEMEPFAAAQGGLGLSSGGNVTQPALAQPVDTKRVHDWLLDVLTTSESNAKAVSRKGLWDRIDGSVAAYNINKKAIDPADAGVRAASAEQEYEIKTEDLADQVDEMTALITNLLSVNGPVCRLVAKPGIPDKQAELTQQVQDSLLREKDFDAVKRKVAGRFVKHCVAGLKVCRTHEVSYKTERIEVPLYQESLDPMTGQPVLIPMYTDEALAMRGYDPSDPGSLQSALAEDGFTFVGIADMREDGRYDNLLCTRCEETSQDFVFIDAVDARRIAISDMTRDMEHQQSIHEYHYLSMSDLRKGYFHNLDKLEKKGGGIENTSAQKPGGGADFGIQEGRLTQPVYEVIESWMEIPWEQGVRDGKFTEDELRSFAIENGFPINEVTYPTQKWCAFHCGGEVLLKLYPNYLMDKCEFPYDMDSFVFADGQFVGQGLMERLSSVVANKTAFLNLVARTIKQNLYQSVIMSGSVELSDGDFKALRRPAGFIKTDSRVDLTTDMHVFQVPDTTQSGMRMIGYLDESMRGLGVPAVLAGEGQADTATQEAINNRRGQTVVNEAFARLMRVFVNAYRKHLGVMVNSFTESRFIDIVGEDGATMNRRWTMPREITDKLDIVPIVSFDDANKQRMSQFFLGLINVLAPVQGPQVVLELATIAMEKAGVQKQEIERILKTVGSQTNVHQEIKAMLQDPELVVEVKMEDPHPVCIMMANMAIMREQARAAQLGYEYQPPFNIQEYIATHEAMQQQQQMMQAMQMMMAGGAPQQGPKGKPVQGRADGGPGSEEGGARQDGQAAGQGNKGPMSAAGLTGQNSVGNVPGVPAGA